VRPIDIPLLNTLILVSSGVSITVGHMNLLEWELENSFIWSVRTVVLGLYFTILQIYEYSHTSFSMSDSVYGSIFFIATGFHGLHVVIGSLIILVQSIRLKLLHFSPSHHVGYEIACWYWHFVDVVWLFLYVAIYCWGY
jgi:heme/copper-type cytochrome/quinol oxidase subunit 3